MKVALIHTEEGEDWVNEAWSIDAKEGIEETYAGLDQSMIINIPEELYKRHCDLCAEEKKIQAELKEIWNNSKKSV